MNDDTKVTDAGTAGTSGATDWIGRRVRTFRTARNTTVADLAGRAGVSSAQLSRIESGDRQPSVGALLSLAHALGVTLSELVAEEPSPTVHVVRGADAPVHRSGSGDFTALSGPLPGIQALRLTLTADPGGDVAGADTAPGAGSPETPVTHADPPAVHDGEEWVHVLSGTVELTVGGSRTTLDTEDSAHFRSDVPHSLAVPDGAESASVLLVTTGHHD